MKTYSHLNRIFRQELSCFPQDKPKFNFSKFFLRISQGLGIFLILSLSLKLLSIPATSFYLNNQPNLAIHNSEKTDFLTLKEPDQKLERLENIEAKASQNFNLLPISALKVKKLKGENDGQVNFLILGIPGKSSPAPYLTDSIMMASLLLQEGKLKKVILISIPRDLLVRIPGGYVTKINNLYILDKKKLENLEHLELFEKTVTEITSLKPHYFVVMDLDGLGKLVDTFGGIKIFVEKPIYDPKFPAPNRGYETFILAAGWQYLDGETAEKYVRVRNNDSDYGRIVRQQQIIRALREKLTELNLFWDLPTLLKIEQILSSHFETNLTKEEGARILELLENLVEENIIYKVIEPSTGLITSGTINLAGSPAFVLWPKAGQFNYSEIQQYISTLIHK